MSKPKRLALMLLTVAVIVFGCGSVAILVMRPKFDPPALPVPNGYDDLLRAAEMIAPRTGLLDEMEPGELRTVVEQNKRALELAREALKKKCGVTHNWSTDPSAGGDPTMIDRVTSMRTLSRAFASELREQMRKGHTEAAIDAGVDGFRLGNECYRGGLLVDYLLGIAAQSASIDGLREVVRADGTARSEILQRITPLLGTGEPVEHLILRELEYIDSAVRGITGRIVLFQTQDMTKATMQVARQTDLRCRTQHRLFVIHLALHSYHDEHQQWPNELAELAPEFLTDVPVDPYSQKDFIYRVENDSYRLYSVAGNRRDDGGEGDETGLQLDMVYDLDPAEEAQ